MDPPTYPFEETSFMNGPLARGGRGEARALPEFGRSVNPIQTRVDRIFPSQYCQPPRIQKAIYTSDKYVALSR